jgi:hypothetical protein
MDKLIGTILIAATQQLYQAQVPTYGCNSIDNVVKLEQMRADQKAFQSSLYELVVQGDCVMFVKGAVVEGAPPESADSKAPLLHVQATLDPPGYIAPLGDFKRQERRQGSPDAGNGPNP